MGSIRPQSFASVEFSHVSHQMISYKSQKGKKVALFGQSLMEEVIYILAHYYSPNTLWIGVYECQVTCSLTFSDCTGYSYMQC